MFLNYIYSFKMLQTEEEYVQILEGFKTWIIVKGCIKCKYNKAICKNSTCKARYSILKNIVFAKN